MSVLSDNYKRIIAELEEKISNPEDLKFVKEKFIELSTMFLDVIDNFTEKTDAKISELEEKQQFIEEKIAEVESAVNEIETDMYDDEDEEEDSSYEFEIVCPYCNHEFVAEIAGKNEVTCPECNNSIELDWNEEEGQNSTGCVGGCTTCGGCENGFEQQDYEQEDNEDEEDDM